MEQHSAALVVFSSAARTTARFLVLCCFSSLPACSDGTTAPQAMGGAPTALGGAPSATGGALAVTGGAAAATGGTSVAAGGTTSVTGVASEIRALALSGVLAPPADPSNQFSDDPRAVALGHRLFFDPGFSGALLDGDNDGGPRALGRKGEAGKIACAGCHVPADQFNDTRSLRTQISLAAGWGHRKTPSLLDVAQSKLLMWDGRRDALYNQVFGALESPVEMNTSRLYVAQQLLARYRAEYEALFGALPPLTDATRFPQLSASETGCSALDETRRGCRSAQHGAPGDAAAYDGMVAADQELVTRVVVNMGKALAAYQRKLSCGTSRFDKWALGTDPTALNESEQRGAALFVGKAKCSSCHSGPLLSDEKFHNVGLKPAVVATVFLSADDAGAEEGLAAMATDELNVKGKFSDGDDGRASVALGPEARGAFRTPRLRCISKRPSFMHTGQLRTLEDTIAFFNRGGDEFGFLGTKEISALELTVEERADLAAFLRTLEGPGPDPALLVAP